MEDTLKALIKEHKKWMQEQIDAQSQRLVDQQRQTTELLIFISQ